VSRLWLAFTGGGGKGAQKAAGGGRRASSALPGKIVALPRIFAKGVQFYVSIPGRRAGSLPKRPAARPACAGRAAGAPHPPPRRSSSPGGALRRSGWWCPGTP
jgi:hypothetical protein